MSSKKPRHKVPLNLIFFIIGFLILALGGCSVETQSPVTPSPNKLTFLFFYTEG